jgi:hypothetical protein
MLFSKFKVWTILQNCSTNFGSLSSVRLDNANFLKANTITPGVNRNFKIKKYRESKI